MKFSEKLNKIDADAVARRLAESVSDTVAADERKYEDEIDAVRDHCIKNSVEVVLLCGPSAAGKTTTSKILEREFRELGHPVNRISLDNFYRPKSEMPLWEDGTVNLESIEGLNIPLFAELVNKLFRDGRCDFPVFDFVTGRPTKKFTLSHFPGSVLIVEGIHALNPEIYEIIAGRSCCRLYISTHSDFVRNGEVVLPAAHLRLMRRSLRDYRHRGASLGATLDLWKYIRKGEDLYIHPFRKYADFHIDTAHSYEPFLYALPMADMISRSDCDKKHRELLASLLESARQFSPLPYDVVPPGSLIREFIS
jgi:uridine kinase